MQPGYELFDHTADMGIRVWASTLAGLIAPAAKGLYAAIGELVTTGPTQPFQFARRGPEPEFLLRDLLNELLILFERDHRRVQSFQSAELDAEHLSASGSSALIDEGRSTYYREVKAITYHELRVRNVGDHFEAVFIVDI